MTFEEVVMAALEGTGTITAKGTDTLPELGRQEISRWPRSRHDGVLLCRPGG